MPSYNLDALGSDEFEKLVQALLKEVIGSGTVTFGAGKDGAREATFVGEAPYPSHSERWSGNWIFQAKFHDTKQLGVDKARKKVIEDLDNELQKITTKYHYKCDNYILVTNVPLTAVADSGNLDKIEQEVKPRYRASIPNIHVWGADDVNKLLEKYSDVRTAYLHFIVPGDLIAQLLQQRAERVDDLTVTIRDYIQTLFSREQHAQLDQAGDVSEEPVRIQHVFFDLNAHVSQFSTANTGSEVLRQLRRLEVKHNYFPGRDSDGISPLKTLISETLNRVVVVGGPGEGKSTIGQYLAQLHRGSMLKKVDEIAIDDSFIPALPRIPFRITLRDFAQWLARQGDTSPGTVHSLDEYLAYQIHQASKREISVNDLHKVIRENPTLLILDGLDEVSGQTIRKSLLERVAEFTDRCEGPLAADMQILASTRPTGYSNQFDPQRYLHVHLAELSDLQVRHYVDRWIIAKDLERTKAERLRASIDECLADPQISLLTNTPLQVTILVLIISGGGTPPRQREALFNEYLDVIFKRETAKGKHIISSEKEKLVGLHKYVGYLLHERTTIAQDAGSELSRAEYEKTVNEYLRFCDPYSQPPARRSELRGITREAGERLVLLVEKRSDVFGFELRSIQEFFAACHLSDTSKDTTQRYKRFDAIAYLDHWRNVALFFAGRVGRNYPGESANIVESCRNLNRESFGNYTKRGSILALELAADRAFNHNRRQQNDLLEIGLEIINRGFSDQRRLVVLELLQRLPGEDVRDLLVPLLKQRIDLLSAEHMTQLPYILYMLNAPSSMMYDVIEKLATDPRCHERTLQAIFWLKLPQSEMPGTIARLAGQLSPSQVGPYLGRLSWRAIEHATSNMLLDGVPEDFVNGALSHGVTRLSFANQSVRNDFAAVIGRAETVWPNTLPGMALSAISVLYSYTFFEDSRHRRRRFVNPDNFDFATVTANIPPEVVDGTIFATDGTGVLTEHDCLGATLWGVHLILGAVTESTIRTFISQYIDHRSHECLYDLSRIVDDEYFPFFDFLETSIESGGNLDDVVEAFVHFGGNEGRDRWSAFCEGIKTKLRALPSSQREAVLNSPLTALSRGVLETLKDPAVGFPVELIEYGLLYGRGIRFEAYSGNAQAVRAVVDNLMAGRLLLEPRRAVLTMALRRGGSRDAVNVDISVLEDMFKLLLALKHSAWNVSMIAQLLCSYFDLPSIRGDFTDRVLVYLENAVREKRMPLYVAIDETQLSAMTQCLVTIVAERDNGVRRTGAIILLTEICRMTQLMASHREVHLRARFSGFSARHRSIAGDVRSVEEENLALALFCIRVPSSAADWKILERLLLKVASNEAIRFVNFVAEVAPYDVKNLDKWIALMRSLLESGRREQEASVIIDALLTLSSASGQSLAHEELDLGLPLQS